jgi:hypothetical protein
MGGTSGLERRTVDGIVVETLPFLKGISNSLVCLLGVPDQHLRAIINSNFFAVSFDDSFGVVQKIIGIDNGDTNFTILQFAMLPGNSWTDLIFFAKEIEDPAKFIVTSLGRHEIVEAGDFVKRRNGASVVRWDTVTRVSDQEREVELLQDLCWDDSRIAWLCFRVVGVGGLVMTVRNPICNPIGGSVRDTIDKALRLAICPDSFLNSLSSQRWSDSSLFSLGWYQVVGDVLDKEAFSLHDSEFPGNHSLRVRMVIGI